jgi:hypothetical protein
VEIELTECASVRGREDSTVRIACDERTHRVWLPRTTFRHRRTFQDISGVARGATSIFSESAALSRPAGGLTGLILQVTNRILRPMLYDWFWIFEGMKLISPIRDLPIDAHAAPSAEPAL